MTPLIAHFFRQVSSAKLLSIVTFSAILSTGCSEPKVSVVGDWTLASEGSNGYTMKLMGSEGQGILTFVLDDKPLDVSAFSHIGATVKNQSTGRLDLRLKVQSDPTLRDRYSSSRVLMHPGQARGVRALLTRDYFPKDHPWTKTFGRIRGLPGGHFSNWRYLDNENIRLFKVTISWEGVNPGGTVVFSSPFGSGAYTTDQLTPDDLPQPLLDEMGQLVGQDWEGRVGDREELREDGIRDLETFTNHPVREGFSEYGGWKDGPRFDATGHFYTKKVDGKWWFVGPDGYLFWSLGVTGVGGGAVTPIKGRERFFPDLRENEFFREENDTRGYDFTLGNLYRKYGRDWRTANQQVTFGRMRAWGLNSTGAWSVSEVLGHGMVPYTIIIHPKLQELGGLTKVPDPFSREFRNSLLEKLMEAEETYGQDPWNLGVFIDNELHWGRGTQIAREVIDLDSSVPAKDAMVKLYKQKYDNIDALNAAWDSGFKGFNAIRGLLDRDGNEAYQDDLKAFVDFHADTYFAFCKSTLEQFMPGHLYLGCRFHGNVYDVKNVIVQNAASRHVDVMSYNIYKNSILDVRTDQEVDRPILIGEFHFGTASHGVWGSGLVTCDTIEDQATLYQIYVKEALEHPSFVGAHWFKWADHPTTGRYDGENYRIGFVSIVDRAFKELTDAIKGVSKNMYPLRSSGD